MAKYSPTWRGRVVARTSLRAVALEHEVDGQAVRSGRSWPMADWIWSPLNSGGLASRSRTWPSCDLSLPSGTKSSWPVWPTRRRTASTIRDARAARRRAVAALGRDDRLGDAGRVDAALDDVLDDAHVSGVGRRRRPAAPGTRPAGRPRGPDRAWSRRVATCRRRCRVGQRSPGKKSTTRASTPMSDDQDGAGSTHRGGMLHETPATAMPARCTRGSGLQGRLDPLGQRPADARAPRRSARPARRARA